MPEGCGEAGVELLRFGDFEFDPQRLLLRRRGQPQEIEARPLEVLAVLLANAGELVSKRDLMDSVWADRVVTEGALTRCIAKLRAILGDSSQTLILSVHGYGYRYTGPVPRAPDEPAPPLPAPQTTLAPGMNPPQRPHWRLVHPLDQRGQVWVAAHEKSAEQRVYKFAETPERAQALKRELTLYRLFQKALPGREDLARLLDYNLEIQPYFLELDYCAAGNLFDWLAGQGGAVAVALAQRIEILARAAEAIAATHAIGVLHRDIKPANLLMRGAGDERTRVCWTDFGSSELDPAQLERWRVTRLGYTQASAGRSDEGTPLYLAPERMAGEAATTHSDVYSLGVLLYQLVVGDLRRPLTPGWEREVSDPLLRADIAACCDYDPQHRLGDAAELAARLRALPLRRERAAAEARERVENDRAREQLARSRVRRPWVLAAALALIAGTGISLALYFQMRSALGEAEQSAATLAQINRFINDQLLAGADPFKGGGRHVTVVSLLDRASQRLAEDVSASAEVRSELGRTLGQAYLNLGLWPRAREQLERSVADAQAAFGAGSPQLFELQFVLADTLTQLDDFSAAATLYRNLLDDAQRYRGEHSPEALDARSGLAWLEYQAGNYLGCAAAYERLLADAAAWAVGSAGFLADSRWNLAEAYVELGRIERAQALLAAVRDSYIAQRGAGHALVDWVNTSIVNAELSAGRYERAEALLNEIDRRQSQALGEAHNIVLFTGHFRGILRLLQGRFAEAAELLKQVYDTRKAYYGEDHHFTRYAMNRLGEAYTRLGRPQEALALLAPAHQLSQQRLGAAHPHSLHLARNLALALLAAGRPADAQAVAAAALKDSAAHAGNSALLRAHLLVALGRADRASGRSEQAARSWQEAARVYAGAFGDQHAWARIAHDAALGKAGAVDALGVIAF